MEEFVGHISWNFTESVWRQNPARKVAKGEPKKPRKRGRPAREELREPIEEKRLDRQLRQITVSYLYDLMDAAYDSTRMEATSRKFGHVPITEKNGGGQEVIPKAPNKAERTNRRL